MTDWCGCTSVYSERPERLRGHSRVVQGPEERRGLLLPQGRNGEQGLLLRWCAKVLVAVVV